MSERGDRADRVSDYVDSDRIVGDRPDGAHVEIAYLVDQRAVDADEPHDVVVWSGPDSTETAIGFFDREKAAEVAVQEAEERGYPVYDAIHEWHD